MTPQVSPANRGYFIAKPVGLREGAILVAAAWLVPLLVHLIPWAGPRPLGVYLLPVFWTTFIALYFYGALPGLAVGLVAPVVNLALTGSPALSSVGMMSLEITVFVTVAGLLVNRWPGFWLAAPLAWLLTKAGVIAGQYLVPAFNYSDSPGQHILRSTQNALTGLGVLAVIHWLLVAFYPWGDAWERE
jgi:hypothetical protein